MEILMIDLSELGGENRSKTMAILHHACEKWGCFKIKNHGVDPELMEKVKRFVNTHYKENLKASFYVSKTTKCLEHANSTTPDLDWEWPFFLWHCLKSNIEDFPNLSNDFVMDEYIAQVIKLVEKLSNLICENLGLDKDHIKRAFLGRNGPSMGMKVAKYLECPYTETVGDRVSGLEFLHEGQWVPMPQSNYASICVNTGDQLEVVSNGQYKSVLHHVMAKKNGSRLSVATLYNPADDAIILPMTKLPYSEKYAFGDYFHAATKFQGKEPRLESMRKLMGNGCSGAT
ncbi:hypothetical protein EUGRSUZ_C03881 [Eucalyptus grandis]|uniref:Fe2OG dioxygenase domain-containing protein n=2 Tax=Eucalyptus grandis TaxID=71139 RepID=A0A059CWG0_EUCGR|nr:hypothetical protein EUGRSUZ_C03881 [Eucalyptus grandis]